MRQWKTNTRGEPDYDDPRTSYRCLHDHRSSDSNDGVSYDDDDTTGWHGTPTMS